MKKKKKSGGALRIVILVIALLVFGFSAYKVAETLLDAKKTKEAVQALSDLAVEEVKEEDREEEAPVTVLIEKKVTDPVTGETKTVQTEEKIKRPLRIDFDLLKKQCSDIVGWIYCEDTVINYPVVHAADNDRYLHMLPDGSYASGGTLFIDCENSPDLSDFNTIIFGHNMNNGSMFGTIDLYKKQQYYDEHPVMYYYTPEKVYLVELVAGISTDTMSFIYEGVRTEDEQKQFLKAAEYYSTFRSEFTLDPEAKYITMSTCSYETEIARYLLIGKLTEIENFAEKTE